MDNEKLANDITKDIIALRESENKCAPSTLMGICRNVDCDLSEEQLAILSSGFASGIGGDLEEGTCGAITGATIALGLTGKDTGKVKEISKIIFDNFKNEFGSVECNKLTKNGSDKTHCTGYCVYVGKLFGNLINSA